MTSPSLFIARDALVELCIDHHHAFQLTFCSVAVVSLYILIWTNCTASEQREGHKTVMNKGLTCSDRCQISQTQSILITDTSIHLLFWFLVFHILQHSIFVQTRSNNTKTKRKTFPADLIQLFTTFPSIQKQVQYHWVFYLITDRHTILTFL